MNSLNKSTISKILLPFLLLVATYSCSNMLGDIIAPKVGGSGELTVVDTYNTDGSNDTVTISWEPASDESHSSGSITYIAYFTDFKPEGDKISEITGKGTFLEKLPAGTTSLTLEKLALANGGKQGFITIIAKDPKGNSSLYTTKAISLIRELSNKLDEDSKFTLRPDTDSPVPGGTGGLDEEATITADNVTSTSVELQWIKAGDDRKEDDLEYIVVISESNNIVSLEDAEKNGLVKKTWSSENNADLADLEPGKTYWYNVIVKDRAGNKAVYKSGSITTTTSSDSIAPTPGASNGAGINNSNKNTTSFTLSWNKASDNVSAEEDLKYKIIISTQDNISSVTLALSNDELNEDWTADIETFDVTNLTQNTSYWYNVLVMDEAGLKASYNHGQITTNQSTDTTKPSVGDGNKTITVGTVETDSIQISWNKSTDNRTADADLLYKVVYSTSNNVNNLSGANSGTVAKTWTADLGTWTIDSLNPDTTYYFNVIVKDEAGNSDIYTSGSKKTNQTPDNTKPSVGDGNKAISIGTVGTDSIQISWNKSTDNKTSNTDLLYKVVYSTSNSVNTLTGANSGSVAKTWTADLGTWTIDSLNPDTTYYFNVIVKDEAGNSDIYTSGSKKTNQTPDNTKPSVGDGNKAISIGTVGSDSIQISWNKSTDNKTSNTDLLYKVVYSTSNSVNTLTGANSGTVAKTWTADLGTWTIDSLNPDTTYYFNVIVKDEAGNSDIYTSGSQKTSLAVSQLTLDSVTPGDNDIEIDLEQVVTVKFNEVLTADHKSDTEIIVKKGAAAVSGTLSYPDSKTIIFTPLTTYDQGAEYTITAVSSVNGTIGSAKSFTTIDYSQFISHWKFDGDATDSSGNGRDITTSVTSYSTNDDRHSISMDGSSNGQLPPSYDLGDSFTVTAWVNMGATLNNSLNTIISNGLGEEKTDGFKLCVNSWNKADGRIIIEVGNGTNGGKFATPEGTVLANGWYHLAFVIKRTGSGQKSAGDFMEIYFNGVKQTLEYLSEDATAHTRTQAEFDANAWDFKTDGPFTFGAFPNNPNGTYNFKGNIDDMRAYKKILTEAEIIRISQQKY